MKYAMFTIHDSKAQAYITPWFLPEVGQAVRAFGDCVNSDTHQFGLHPEDYTLFEIGEYDDSNGECTPTQKLSIANGMDVLKPKTQPDLFTKPLDLEPKE